MNNKKNASDSDGKIVVLTEGYVTKYLPHKGYGFVRTGQQSAFFHINQGRKMEPCQCKGAETRIRFAKTKETIIPQEGNVLVFILIRGKKGKWCKAWAFATEYNRLTTTEPALK